MEIFVENLHLGKRVLPPYPRNIRNQGLRTRNKVLSYGIINNVMMYRNVTSYFCK